MLCLRIMKSLSLGSKAVAPRAALKTSRRFLTTRTLVRPSVFPQSALLQPSQASIAESESSPNSVTPQLDLLPKISSHPALASIQVRNGPRDTYDPSHFVRKRRSGFLARKRSRTGRMILQRRRLKKRSTLSH